MNDPAYEGGPTQGPDRPTGVRGESDLQAVLGAMRRRWILIAACALLTGLTAMLFSLSQEKEYSAKAKLLSRDPGFAQQAYVGFLQQKFGNPADPGVALSGEGAASNLELVDLPVVADRTATALGQGATRDEIEDVISTSPGVGGNTISIKATDSSPERATRIANTYARQFVALRAAADRSQLLEAKRRLRRQFDQLSPADRNGPRGNVLSRSAERLGILALLQTGNVELVQPAEVPDSPSSANTGRAAVLGALLGLLLGVALVFLFEHLNRRLRRPEEAGEAFGQPVLAIIPESKAISAGNALPGNGNLPPMENEAFRTLRAGLRYFNVDREVRSVLVSSASPAEGKTTVAWQLARAAATSSKAIVVEADFRNPSLARQHGLTESPGLSEILTQQTPLSDAIQSIPISASASGNGSVVVSARGRFKEGEESLHVITAGATPPNPAELIESKAMGNLFAELRQRYDLVVLDTPPTGVVSDSFPLMGKVDGVIVVARVEQTTRDSAERFREQLGRLRAPVLGVVANAVKISRRSRYAYGNRSNDRAPSEPRRRASVAAGEARD